MFVEGVGVGDAVVRGVDVGGEVRWLGRLRDGLGAHPDVTPVTCFALASQVYS